MTSSYDYRRKVFDLSRFAIPENLEWRIYHQERFASLAYLHWFSPNVNDDINTLVFDNRFQELVSAYNRHDDYSSAADFDSNAFVDRIDINKTHSVLVFALYDEPQFYYDLFAASKYFKNALFLMLLDRCFCDSAPEYEFICDAILDGRSCHLAIADGCAIDVPLTRAPDNAYLLWDRTPASPKASPGARLQETWAILKQNHLFGQNLAFDKYHNIIDSFYVHLGKPGAPAGRDDRSLADLAGERWRPRGRCPWQTLDQIIEGTTLLAYPK